MKPEDLRGFEAVDINRPDRVKYTVCLDCAGSFVYDDLDSTIERVWKHFLVTWAKPRDTTIVQKHMQEGKWFPVAHYVLSEEKIRLAQLRDQQQRLNAEIAGLEEKLTSKP